MTPSISTESIYIQLGYRPSMLYIGFANVHGGMTTFIYDTRINYGIWYGLQNNTATYSTQNRNYLKITDQGFSFTPLEPAFAARQANYIALKDL